MTSYSMLVPVFVLALSSYASAFFLSWGQPEKTSPVPAHYYYHKRYLPGPSYTIESEQRNQIPSVPVQVPLQAQLSPASTVQNVQLVPCLCPVSQEYPYGTVPQQQENIYVNGLPLQQIPQQQQPPQQQQLQLIQPQNP